jgi:hypothetical protein
VNPTIANINANDYHLEITELRLDKLDGNKRQYTGNDDTGPERRHKGGGYKRPTSATPDGNGAC